MIKKYIEKVVAGQDLSEQEAFELMGLIMEGQASPAQIACLLTALRLKGETVDEITGFARVMRNKVTPVKCSHPTLVDTCGTGGDGSNTFNISTTAALVLAGAGVRVAKHGNRSVSSRCGSADVLEALGVRVDLEPHHVSQCLEKIGIGFLFAPALHGAMKYAAGPRREIGIRTVFNILGPLTNPAGARAQVLGVYSKHLVTALAKVLARLGATRAFVIHGAGGLDEISPAGPAVICEVNNGTISEYNLDPAEFGIERTPVEKIRGGSPELNAKITLDILKGARGPGRDAVIMNAALGMIAGGAAKDPAGGIAKAQESIDSGAALDKLEQLIDFTGSNVRRVAIL